MKFEGGTRFIWTSSDAGYAELNRLDSGAEFAFHSVVVSQRWKFGESEEWTPAENYRVTAMAYKYGTSSIITHRDKVLVK